MSARRSKLMKAGIFLGFMANLIVVSYVSNSFRGWRILTNTVLIPTIPLLIMIYLMPESPRYLMKHGKYKRALEAFIMIQTTPLLASRDFMYAHAQLDFESRLMRADGNEQGNLADRIVRSENDPPSGITRARGNGQTSLSVSPAHSVRLSREERAVNGREFLEPRDSHQQSSSRENHRQNGNVELSNFRRQDSDLSSLDAELANIRAERQDNPYVYHIGVTGYFKRLGELWSNKRCRRALLSSSIAMLTQQLSGVNTIAFLGTTVWENSLGTATSPKVSAIIGLIFGAANYIGGLPSYWLSDKFGRSIMLLFGLPNTAWSMLVFALLFQIREGSAARVPLVSIMAVIFTLFYAPTAGTGPFSISAEVFP